MNPALSLSDSNTSSTNGVDVKPSLVTNEVEPNLLVGDGIFPKGIIPSRGIVTWYIGQLLDRHTVKSYKIDPINMAGFNIGKGFAINGCNAGYPPDIPFDPFGFDGCKANACYPGSKTPQQNACFEYKKTQIWNANKQVWEKPPSHPVEGMWGRFPLRALKGKKPLFC